MLEIQITYNCYSNKMQVEGRKQKSTSNFNQKLFKLEKLENYENDALY